MLRVRRGGSEAEVSKAEHDGSDFHWLGASELLSVFLHFSVDNPNIRLAY
jgi:hypothetical protein